MSRFCDLFDIRKQKQRKYENNRHPYVIIGKLID